MQCIIKPKYHVGRGKRLKRFGDGWTDNGQEYYQELLRIFKELKTSDVWNTLQDHWKLYQKKHYARDDNQVEVLREPEEECKASDKDDWQIDMTDGDEIGDIEEASVDDDSPDPRNRPRLGNPFGIPRNSAINLILDLWNSGIFIGILFF